MSCNNIRCCEMPTISCVIVLWRDVRDAMLTTPGRGWSPARTSVETPSARHCDRATLTVAALGEAQGAGAYRGSRRPNLRTDHPARIPRGRGMTGAAARTSLRLLSGGRRCFRPVAWGASCDPAVPRRYGRSGGSVALRQSQTKQCNSEVQVKSTCTGPREAGLSDPKIGQCPKLRSEVCWFPSTRRTGMSKTQEP